MTDDEQLRKEAIDRLKNKRGFYQNLVAYLVVNAFLVAIWALSGADYFWPIWVMAGWGLGLVLHAWSVFGQKPITEEAIRKEMGRGDTGVA